ncbi:hypothetical protein [Comamonas sp. NoAH]|uniref:hypothetical protein n=1 Tax=Comamonas halotolerans TaxID=3041496 RepID=UPI0024E07C62|nr:hypothetical protein [Comamonas sp. NoAH]
MPPEPTELHPLGLTVHNPPSMQTLSQGVHYSGRQRKGRWKMLAVLVVCAAPVVASYLTYYVIRPEGRRNFGELIEPQQAMPEGLMASTLDGQTVPLSSLKGQWLLLSTSSAACNAQCEEHLYLQRQLREGLGREKDRLDWVWLIQDGQQPSPALKNALQTAQVLQVDAQRLSTWLQPAADAQLSDHLYVIDPQGNWMMRFPPGMDKGSASKVKRDLERLLRASASWDQAGR